MRALWTGHVTCGMVTVPVRLYAATEDPRPRMHQVHTADGSRIRHRRVCEAEAREVSEAEISRGWEAPDGRMVVLRDEDLDHLPLATRKTVEIMGFVGEQDVDPLLYDRGYFAGPDGPVAQRPYALLVEALARTARVGIAKFAVRTRERLAVLRPRRGILVVHALRWPQELRQPGDMASSAPVTERELELAEVLIGQLTGVDIAEVHDEYGAALEQVVTAKLEGLGWAEPPEPQPSVDLMQALEDSIRQARRGEQ
ncbi:DNA end-binding protein Ku [Streptomyces sp. SLBN-118]|uniref:non-homologous end joining protein Ku n=1 Tax=Streptomyces sp. SLBN-118 TaxID=2768454 RepID=UPI0011523DAC|nr:Ku protein [Streptomyces sp. SLBN-118]TQK49882.1 DNA end-binding protein Ku [Streptomyces sp. SLBN-118]